MLDKLLATLAPHHCYTCGFEGLLLCHNCRYDIISEPYARCLSCGRGVVSQKCGLCSSCHPCYSVAWCVGERHDALELLINGLKFEHRRAAADILAGLIAERLPELPSDTIIVPIPTIPSHIRERGYDHTRLIARRVAVLKGLRVESGLLRRHHNSKQRGANRAQRLKQAATAFRCAAPPRKVPYLLLDDVVTTGATLDQAARVLREAGAETVWAVAASRQPLD